MKQFKIFYNESTNQTEVVKLGWSWPAFFLTFIYALVRRNWKLAGIMLVVNISIYISFMILISIMGGNTQSIGMIIWPSIFMGVIWGKIFNSFYEKQLVKDNFKFKDTVSATNSELALVQSLKKS